MLSKDKQTPGDEVHLLNSGVNTVDTWPRPLRSQPASMSSQASQRPDQAICLLRFGILLLFIFFCIGPVSDIEIIRYTLLGRVTVQVEE